MPDGRKVAMRHMRELADLGALRFAPRPARIDTRPSVAQVPKPMATAAIISASEVLELADPLPLDCGQQLPGVRIAYEAYGTLAPERDNVILVMHATTGDQHVASPHPITGKPGWWNRMIGAGKPIDTDRYHVICANVIGGCMGSTGPASEAADGQPHGMRFPVITIRDMGRAQVAL